MIWNANIGISYVDYKLAALQAAGWRIRKAAQVESVGAITYVATKNDQRVVLSFNDKDQLIKLTGSINKKMGAATLVSPYDKDTVDRFMKYFKAL